MRLKKPKGYNPGKNLGAYLHKAKMPTGSKIGAASTTKLAKKSKIRRMKTPRV